MERETTTKNIGPHTFTVKTYATAREMAAIRNVYFKGARFGVEGGQPKIDEYNPAIQYDMQVEMFRQLVVAIDGDSTKVDERAQDLPNDIFEELTNYLDGEIVKKTKR